MIPGLTLGMKLKDAKAGFFDRAAVINATDRATRRVLSRFGAFVRRSAQLSIRTRDGFAPPGSPPHGHTGLLRKFILFSFDQDRRSVVIGPTLLNGKAYKDTAPALEYGGTFMRRSFTGTRMARYRARPFMAPAFDANISKLPGMWRDAIKA